jgi:hypothetical protein
MPTKACNLGSGLRNSDHRALIHLEYDQYSAKSLKSCKIEAVSEPDLARKVRKESTWLHQKAPCLMAGGFLFL